MSIRENFCFRLRSWLSSFSLRLESGERGGGRGWSGGVLDVRPAGVGSARRIGRFAPPGRCARWALRWHGRGARAFLLFLRFLRMLWAERVPVAVRM